MSYVQVEVLRTRIRLKTSYVRKLVAQFVQKDKAAELSLTCPIAPEGALLARSGRKVTKGPFELMKTFVETDCPGSGGIVQAPTVGAFGRKRYCVALRVWGPWPP